MRIGIWADVDPSTATGGLTLLCQGSKSIFDLALGYTPVPMQVWDSGGPTYGTEACQLFGFVAP